MACGRRRSHILGPTPYSTTARIALAAVAAYGMTSGAARATAQTGSGTVSFAFTSFSGPIGNSTYADRNDPSAWSFRGLVNGIAVAPSGGRSSGGFATQPDRGYDLGSTTLTPSTAVSLRYSDIDAGSVAENLITFTPRSFTNVSRGQNFILGTLTFQNGSWYGGGGTAAYNVTSDLGFTITTTSADGAAFNQTITGAIRMVVNAPDGRDCTVLAGPRAEADWIYIDSPAAIGTLGSFRVYDDYCKPDGFTNVGTVDVVARFNSLTSSDTRILTVVSRPPT